MLAVHRAMTARPSCPRVSCATARRGDAVRRPDHWGATTVHAFRLVDRRPRIRHASVIEAFGSAVPRLQCLTSDAPCRGIGAVAIDWSSIILEPEQEETLSELAEATRRIPRESRHAWIVLQETGPTQLIMSGNPVTLTAQVQDLDVLHRAGLVSMARAGRNFTVYVTPLGFRYYEHLRTRSAEPVAQLEDEVRRLLEGEAFGSRHRHALAAWSVAAATLWSADDASAFRAIGAHCREAMQLYATDLVEHLKPADADPDSAHTRNRLRAAVDTQRVKLGDRASDLLQALVAMWDAADGAVQQLVHAGQKQGSPLGWEDVRRTVFLAGVVMFELDRALT